MLPTMKHVMMLWNASKTLSEANQIACWEPNTKPHNTFNDLVSVSHSDELKDIANAPEDHADVSFDDLDHVHNPVSRLLQTLGSFLRGLLRKFSDLASEAFLPSPLSPLLLLLFFFIFFSSPPATSRLSLPVFLPFWPPSSLSLRPFSPSSSLSFWPFSPSSSLSLRPFSPSSSLSLRPFSPSSFLSLRPSSFSLQPSSPSSCSFSA